LVSVFPIVMAAGTSLPICYLACLLVCFCQQTCDTTRTACNWGFKVPPSLRKPLSYTNPQV